MNTVEKVRRQFAGILLLACVCAAQTSGGFMPVLPMAKGTYWTYEATATWNLTPNETTSGTVQRRMQVVDAVSGRGYQAALLKGGPWDFAFYDPAKPPGTYAIVQTEWATYFLQNQQASDVFRVIQRSGLTHEVKDTLAENLWFRTPIRSNGTYCPPDQLGREDRMYCWAVMDVKAERISGIAGVKAGMRTTYHMAYRTNPDHELVDLVPGIGITHFQYAHHGTKSEADVKLIAYHAGKAESR